MSDRMKPFEAHSNRGAEQMIKVGGKPDTMTDIVFVATIIVIFTIKLGVGPLM